MKVFNSFDEMFNARSKQDMSVFNKVVLLDHKPADEHTAQWLDYEPYETYKYSVVRDTNGEHYSDLYVECYRCISGEIPSRIDVTLLKSSMHEDGTADLVRSVVDEFVAEYGVLEKVRTGDCLSGNCDYSIKLRRDYDRAPELTRELAERLDDALYVNGMNKVLS